MLRADQYAGLASFAEVGPFAPFQYDWAGALVREVAPARVALALPDQPGAHWSCPGLVALPPFWCSKEDHARSKRSRSRSALARPYMWRLVNYILVNYI